MEKVVRPFQLDEGVAARRIPVDQQAPAAKVKLQAGRSTGSGKTVGTSASMTMSFYCEAPHVEDIKTIVPLKKKPNNTPRQTHIKRFWGFEYPDGTSASYYDHEKEEEPDTDNPVSNLGKPPPGSTKVEDRWVDVQRIDRMKIKIGKGRKKRELTLVFKWYDQDKKGDNPRRKREWIKIHDPNQWGPQLLPEADRHFIEIAAFEKCTIRERGRVYTLGLAELEEQFKLVFGELGPQLITNSFRNEVDQNPFNREGRWAKVVNRDLKGDPEPDAKGFFLTPYEFKEPVAGSAGGPSVTSMAAGDVKPYDEDQKAIVWVTDKFTYKSGQGPQYEKRLYILKNEYLKTFMLDVDESDPGESNVKRTRYDPFENVVNVSWGGLAVEFGDGAEGPPR